METAKLKKFAQYARRELISQISSKLALVLAEDSLARRENQSAVQELQRQIKDTSKNQLIEKVAYIWFNRFCALRFMDVNHYTSIGTVSPGEGQFQPEILAEAKMGHVDDAIVPQKIKQQVFGLLEGRVSSKDPQNEAYRLLLVAVCNYFHKSMPFLFERIADYTELLLPEDLLSGNSILAYTREAMTPDVCEDVEIIGWLYQFYISEKKDEVFDALKRHKKISPENIPAATQLFTPSWVVRFLVENSLGRLWMLNNPQSRLKNSMKFYIPPSELEADHLRVASPEDIRVCDPACGSGHMLVYAFDLLHEIYEEEGYDSNEIPDKILRLNLYGMEIDERAAELASFALVMKARRKSRRFRSDPVQPNICVIEKISFDRAELQRYTDFVGRDLFTHNFLTTLEQFEEADNFGALIKPDLTDATNIFKLLEDKDISGQLLLSRTHPKVLQLLKQSTYLSNKYHVVIANPPYMGAKGMNARLVEWAKQHFPDTKADLFAIFVERITSMIFKNGYAGVMTPFTWMFLASFEKLRKLILDDHTILSLVRPEYHAFFESAYVPICAFVILSKRIPDLSGSFIDLSKFYGADVQEEKLLEAVQNPDCGFFYKASSDDFSKIPGTPIAYWLPKAIFDAFEQFPKIGDHARAAKGLVTANNDAFVREWFEVNYDDIGYGCGSRQESVESKKRWFPYAKGGSFRRWNGNFESLVDWENDGFKIQNTLTEDGSRVRATNFNLDRIFKEGISWTVVTSGKQSFRYVPSGFLFDAAAGVCQSNDGKNKPLLAFLNSKLADIFLAAVNPTLNLHPGYLESLPYRLTGIEDTVNKIADRCMELSQLDWDSYEVSWNFRCHPMMPSNKEQPINLSEHYGRIRDHWSRLSIEMQELERENNAAFIQAYGLENEVTPDVPLNEVSLSFNPHYRYGSDKTNEELESLLLADTVKDLISYAVGCMFGRYSLHREGLVIANQSDSLDTHSWKSTNDNASFSPDPDNVIPILEADWFTDDISERFKRFLRIAFGQQHYEDNIKFVESAIAKDLRKYFLKDFYTDHLKRYKRRPIYWLFSSPKGSFNALIYVHRYRADTASIVLNDYLREFRTKISSRVIHLQNVEGSSDASQSERTTALKEIEKLKKIITELDDYEREILFPLATERISINLDDGVKTNYSKLGSALKKVPGLESSED